jgi:glycosyltransferase involved in cell wall biosynthesis
MNVLVITGDKRFVAGNPRFDLQASAIKKLTSVYFGKGILFPKIPKEQFDVVTVQDPFWRGLFAWFVARRKNAKFNVQLHADLTGQSFFRHILAQIVLRHADSIRVVSKKIEEQVKKMGVHAPIRILPVYIDTDSFRTIIHKAGEQKTQKTIVWMGRFESEKNPLEALSILKDIRNKGIDVKLIMLGKGSLEKELRNKAINLPVEFSGWQDPKPYLAVADVVLCTSLHESWGASIVEALVAGVPVVAPDVGIAKEAGAIVVGRAQLTDAVVEVLTNGNRGVLNLLLFNSFEWAEAWKKTL